MAAFRIPVALHSGAGRLCPMCNTYVIRPKRGAQGLARRVGEAKLASALVRKSDPGVVARADGRVELMRWGFHREFNPAINNARADKLEGGRLVEGGPPQPRRQPV